MRRASDAARVLSIDTSTSNFSLAVSLGEKVLKSRNIRLKHVLSSSIIPAVKGILDKSGMNLKEIDCFAVGLGPGSFTSLRVGLSTVKGFAFAMNKPVIGVSSLDILAMNASAKDAPFICTLCDARRGLVYSSLYKNGRNNAALKLAGDYLLTDIESVLKNIKQMTLFLGDGVKLYRDKIVEKLGDKALFAGEKDSFPKAKNLVPLALERLRQKAYDNLDSLVPLYLYPQDCQVQTKKREKQKNRGTGYEKK